MKDSGYRPSSPLAIFLGIAAFIALMVMIWSLGDITKGLGRVLLYIPERLGLVQVAQAGEVQIFTLQNMPPAVHLPTAGRYAVYTNDYDLLVISDEISRAGTAPWLNVRNASGQPVPVEVVERGLRPYDSPYADGRPIYTFVIPAPGDFQIGGSRRPAKISLLPDRVSGHEGSMIFYILLQLGLLLLVPVYGFNRRRVVQQSRVREVQKLKHIRGDVITQLHETKKR